MTTTGTPFLPPGIDLSDPERGSLEELLSGLVGLTVEEVEADAKFRVWLCKTLARHSPAGLALVTGRGKWQLARHHTIMNREILRAVQKSEGRLILSVSVRAGKSVLGARYTSAWYAGTHPDHTVMLGAHEAGFAAEHAGFARDVLDEYGPSLYGIRVSDTTSARNRWQLAEHAGGMISVGVGGSPIGRGGNLMVIDDPFKSYEAAMSERQRQRVIETWFQSTMSSRIEPGGSIIVICSRWHEEDLSGWLKANYPGDWTEVHIPAICDNPDGDIMGRAAGESFWPERWPTDILRQREKMVGPVIWLAQYQQRPTAPTGGMFPVDKLRAIHREPTTNVSADGVCLDPVLDLRRVRRLCRGWDLAATEGDGDWTVGVLLGQYDDDRWVILDVIRGQWGEAQVRQVIKATAEADRIRYGAGVLIELPQDPAQAGKAQARQMVAMLSGHQARAIPQTGEKRIRAAGIAAQWQMGNVDIVIVESDLDGNLLEPERAAGNRALIDEARVFDKGKHEDCIDALSSAFNRLTAAVEVTAPTTGSTDAFRAAGGRRAPGYGKRQM